MQGVDLHLDETLVPAGLLLLIAYHAQLVYRVKKFPTTTVVGVNQINRQLWVKTMMADGLKNGVLAVQTLRNNIMASTLLATAAMMLCSVIAVLSGGSSTGHGSANASTALHNLIGSKKPLSSIKLLCVMVCFLIAFLCNVQCVRYYSHTSFLISIPVSTTSSSTGLSSANYVMTAINKGGQFWSIGLRAFYFSFPLFLWLFGPIPMFVCSILLTMVLHFLDTAKEFKQTFNVEQDIVINP